ncbi:hypothetical protein CCHR01_09967 [Colletotrichum chrysophilum]|uniref:Uncharacterized protein n=1 Tax=Colletotrichum chrysophilum TaxID=1836956 RepID=A0AAD9EGA6_9PEZI|nr:hypothetical protein CCHR01_09967 [Colletotrichum chrysophilum]
MNPTDRIGSRFQNQISKPGNEVFLDSVDCTIGSGIGITIPSAEKRSDRYRKSTPARKRIDFALLLSTPSTWWVILVCPGVRGGSSSSSSRVVSPSHPHTSCSLPPANPRPAHAQCWSHSNWRSCRSHRRPILPVCTRLNVEEQESSALFVTAAGKATLASRRATRSSSWRGTDGPESREEERPLPPAHCQSDPKEHCIIRADGCSSNTQHPTSGQWEIPRPQKTVNGFSRPLLCHRQRDRRASSSNPGWDDPSPSPCRLPHSSGQTIPSLGNPRRTPQWQDDVRSSLSRVSKIPLPALIADAGHTLALHKRPPPPSAGPGGSKCPRKPPDRSRVGYADLSQKVNICIYWKYSGLRDF